MASGFEDVRDFSHTARKCVVIDQSGNGNVWLEGKIGTVTTGSTYSSLTLAYGTTHKKQFIRNVNMLIPGGVGEIKVVFYDNVVASASPLTGTLLLAAKPSEGFKVQKLVHSGVLGYKISDWTSGGARASINVEYTYY